MLVLELSEVIKVVITAKIFDVTRIVATFFIPPIREVEDTRWSGRDKSSLCHPSAPVRNLDGEEK
jgi:hypothetical protein